MSKHRGRITGVVPAAVVAMLMAIAMTVPMRMQAQNSTKPAYEQLDRYEGAAGFRAGWAGAADGQHNFWLLGGNAEAAGRVYRNISLAANFTGFNSRNTGQGIGISMFSYTFGPRVTFVIPPHRPGDTHRVSMFAEYLVGEAHGFHGLFPAAGQAATTANSMALEATGGVDIRLADNFSLRALQAGWYRTAFPNTLQSQQNNLTVGFGFVLHSKGH